MLRYNIWQCPWKRWSDCYFSRERYGLIDIMASDLRAFILQGQDAGIHNSKSTARIVNEILIMTITIKPSTCCMHNGLMKSRQQSRHQYQVTLHVDIFILRPTSWPIQAFILLIALSSRSLLMARSSSPSLHSFVWIERLTISQHWSMPQSQFLRDLRDMEWRLTMSRRFRSESRDTTQSLANSHIDLSRRTNLLNKRSTWLSKRVSNDINGRLS